MKRDDRGVDRLVGDVLRRPIGRSEFIRRAVALGFSASAAGSLFAACSGGGDDAATSDPADAMNRTTPKGGRLRYGTGLTSFDSVDPANWATQTVSMDAIFEGLVTYPPGTYDEVVNQLAESIEESSDGKRIEFKLKEGIQFHGGYGEMTAEDVKYSFERIAGIQPVYPNAKKSEVSTFEPDWVSLEQVKVTGKYTGEIRLKDAFAPLFRTTLPLSSGWIVSKKAVAKLGSKYATNPIGTGPYQQAEYRPNRHQLLERFEDYGGASFEITPFFDWDQIEFVFSPSGQAPLIPLETGELDVVSGFGMSQELLPIVESGEFRVEESRDLGYYFLAMNTQHPSMSDVRVREAIHYAVDVPAIIEVATLGTGTRINAIIPEAIELGYWADAPTYERDIEKAKSLLQEAGVSSLDLDLVGPKVEAEIIQQNLLDIGINVEVLNSATAPDTYFYGEEALKKPALIYSPYSSQPDPHWYMTWWVCEQVADWNWARWCNEDFDRLIAEGARTLDEDKRNEIYIEAQQLMDEEAPVIWLYNANNFTVSKKNIKTKRRPSDDFTMTPKYYVQV